MTNPTVFWLHCIQELCHLVADLGVRRKVTSPGYSWSKAMHPLILKSQHSRRGSQLLLTMIAFFMLLGLFFRVLSAAAPQADLVVKSLTVSASTLGPEDVADIVMVIENQGAASARGFSVNLYVDPNEHPPTAQTISTAQTYYDVELLPDTAFTVTRTGHRFGDVVSIYEREQQPVDDTPLVANYQLYAWVDPPWEDQVTESDETNNLRHSAIPQRPMIANVDPADAQRNTQVTVTLNTRNAEPLTGILSADFGEGITVIRVAKQNDQQATAVIAIAPNADFGARTAQLTTPVESLIGRDLFRVIGPPALLTVVPNQATQGTTLSVTVTATNTHFLSDTTMVDFGPEIIVQHTQVHSPTELTARLVIAPDAVIGPHTVTVTSTHTNEGPEVVQLVDGFHVTDYRDHGVPRQGLFTGTVIRAIAGVVDPAHGRVHQFGRFDPATPP